MLFLAFAIAGCESKNQVSKIEIHKRDIVLGNIPLNSSKDFYIVVKNSGSAELQIENIQPSCRCMVAKANNYVVLPDKIDSIQMSLKANSYGKFEESIAILSNTQPKVNLIKVYSKAINEE